ncbi:MAG: winged helix-turn-helix domain-containing protein [Candidatus Hodarchaeales archaeon]
MRIIRDPKVVQIIVEKNRWAIWKLLKKEGPLPAEEIAKKFEKNVSTIYRHLKQLIDVGFVKEKDQQKGNQKYVVKVYSATTTDAFFILSEEAELEIAAQPGETSHLQDTVPIILSYLQSVGYKLKDFKNEEQAKELLSSVLIELSESMGALIGEGNHSLKLKYNHEFEVMRRFVAMFLMQTNLKFEKKVTALRSLLDDPQI